MNDKDIQIIKEHKYMIEEIGKTYKFTEQRKQSYLYAFIMKSYNVKGKYLQKHAIWQDKFMELKEEI